MKPILIATLVLLGCSSDEEWCSKLEFAGETYAKCYEEEEECEEWLMSHFPDDISKPHGVDSWTQCVETDPAEWYKTFAK